MDPALAYLGRCLLLTVAIEVSAAYALGVRSPRNTLVVALAQTVTNPPVAWAASQLGWSLDSPAPIWAAVIALELAAVAIEALVYRFRLDDDSAWAGRPWALSALLNAISFAAGFLF